MANIIKVSHSVQYINDGKAVTSFVCVKELIRILRNSNLLAPFSSLLDTICPRPLLPYRYTNHDLLEQLVVAGLPGREDFNEAQELNNDAFARSCLKEENSRPRPRSLVSFPSSAKSLRKNAIRLSKEKRPTISTRRMPSVFVRR